jgi:anti-anti-sigma regulatory factor
VFSFVRNPDETTSFFSQIINFITKRENFGKSIFIDVSGITHLSSDALMYLLAIVNNMNENFARKYSFSGNAPENPEVRKLFAESGFYHFVKYQGTDPITQNKDNIQIVSGENSDTSVAKLMSDFVSKKAGISIRECSFIYIMMIELMSNTYKHAYSNKQRILFPRWYCFAEYDGNNSISFTFMDTGDGIPATVRKNFAEKIDILKLKGDSKYVTSALNGDFRTSTELSFRGKGLPKIREFCAQSKIQNMRIITNHADVTVFKAGYSTNNLSIPLRGTLYYWQIDISKLKGVTK